MACPSCGQTISNHLPWGSAFIRLRCPFYDCEMAHIGILIEKSTGIVVSVEQHYRIDGKIVHPAQLADGDGNIVYVAHPKPSKPNV